MREISGIALVAGESTRQYVHALHGARMRREYIQPSTSRGCDEGVVHDSPKSFFLTLLLLYGAPNAFAEEWQPVRADTYSSTELARMSGSSTFVDGQYTQRTELPSGGYLREDFVYVPWFGQPAGWALSFDDLPPTERIVPHNPPRVDLANLTIDVSSAVLWKLEPDPVRADVVHPTNRSPSPASVFTGDLVSPYFWTDKPVPITDLGDGLYSATWVVPSGFKTGNPWGAFSEHPIGITFRAAAPPIPEPEAVWMLGIGLGALGFLARRRRQGLRG